MKVYQALSQKLDEYHTVQSWKNSLRESMSCQIIGEMQDLIGDNLYTADHAVTLRLDHCKKNQVSLNLYGDIYLTVLVLPDLSNDISLQIYNDTMTDAKKEMLYNLRKLLMREI